MYTFPFASIHATKWNKNFTSFCLLANVFFYTCALPDKLCSCIQKTFVACILANGKCIHLLRPVVIFAFKLHDFFHINPTKEIYFRDRGSKMLQMKQKKFWWHTSFSYRLIKHMLPFKRRWVKVLLPTLASRLLGMLQLKH